MLWPASKMTDMVIGLDFSRRHHPACALAYPNDPAPLLWFDLFVDDTHISEGQRSNQRPAR